MTTLSRISMLHDRGVLLAVALALSACTTTENITLPATVSSSARPSAEGLLAGFGRADITPPPGLPIAMWGPDGQIAAGHRHRLYARAMVLEDARGEQIAFVVVDLGATSPIMHRFAAAELKERGIGLGADRLIVSATHTHAGPSGFFESKVFNDQSSALPGYDPTLTDFITDSIADAVEQAYRERGPAVAAWDTVHVHGLTRNRSLDAFLMNPESSSWVDSTTSRREQELAAVDVVWSMLRVDACSKGWTDCEPRGAFSVFGIHGTGYPAANDVFDGDIFSVVQRAVERHADGLRSLSLVEAVSPAVHVMANGATGDVSPDHDPGTRCEQGESLEPGWAFSGPRRPLVPEEWLHDEAWLADCLGAAHRSVERIGRALGQIGKRLFDRAGSDLSRNVLIARAFSTRNLRQADSLSAYCESPRFGSASVGGAEDGRTKLYQWRAGWLLSSGFEEGGRARALSPRGCHAEKRLAFGLLQDLLASGLNFPTNAQFSVVRIGDMVVAAVPIEPTVMAAHRMERRMLESGISGVKDAAVVGFANGYLDYLTTREEYAAQHYEGGATIYGPYTAQSMTGEIGRLAASIARGVPLAMVEPFEVGTGGAKKYLANAVKRPPAPEELRVVVSASCENDRMTVEWVDDLPGALRPSEGAIIAIEQETSDGAWRKIVEDDDSSVTVRVVDRASGESARWQMKWEPLELRSDRLVGFIAAGRYRATVLARDRGAGHSRPLHAHVTCQ